MSTSQLYLNTAYKRAGIDPDEWKPEKGFRYNSAILDQLYYYYQEVYFQNPEKFLWAGLARLTGGQVLYGMQNIVRIAKDPCALTVNIVAVAKAIFENMSWQHELFLHDPDLLSTTCNELKEQSQYMYGDCWKKICCSDDAFVSLGNKMLLKNEQFNTIQPYYDEIKKDPYSSRYFWFTRFVMRNIHPHHSRFIFSYPFGDVTNFNDRWKWIEGKKGMWERWATSSREERDRLVGLMNEEVIRHKW